jgi:hypothetical protein
MGTSKAKCVAAVIRLRLFLKSQIQQKKIGHAAT